MYQNYELDALSQNDISAVFQFGRQLTGRLMRCIFYFTIAYMLLTMNAYGLGDSRFALSFIIGLLGIGGASARVGLGAIAVLVVMALVTPEVVELFMEAATDVEAAS